MRTWNQLTSSQIDSLLANGGNPSPALPVTPLVGILYPARRRRRRSNRARVRFVHWPEEAFGERLFPTNGYSFLCGGGRC